MKPETIVSSISREVHKAFRGSSEPVRLLTLALLSEAHVLVEDIPGVGKTTLARAFASAAGLGFARIQFTPDILPGDVLGTSIWSPTEQKFILRQGPIHSQCILADELNRGATRTQAAFLEAMQEYQVTLDGKTTPLPQPFMVLATQNPLEYAGTFQLPEAELDRFAISFSLGYPETDQELEMLRVYRRALRNEQPMDTLEQVLTPTQVLELQAQASRVEVSQAMERYILALGKATREDKALRYGLSPRGLLQLTRLSQTRALLDGRQAVLPEDIRDLWIPCLAHRLGLTGDARISGITLEKRLTEIYESVKFLR
ncbi:AAA family ATPase [Spirochaeta lutea]|uniref:ATPase AAA n=1 Tax=Spirochaeta lutea TaxID=1480694 RepID=A0A098R1Z4_9SPIO|nr:MoxR family ATPase [Spirochaeta lutea]KGE72732.1 hypothetical protein DC28_06760 [Spirochaeta lutea]